jgi:hypothetical protein
MLIRPHQFGKERVHGRIFDPLNAAPFQKFKCERCRRDLPEDQYGVVSWSDKLPKGRGEAVLLHTMCFTCRKQLYGQWVKHPLYNPSLDRFFVKLCTSSRASAKSRGIMFLVDKDDILGLYLEQDAKCAITGMGLKWGGERGGQRNDRAWLRPSIDRIDSGGNYARGNIHIVAQAVNLMKSDLPLEVFYGLCDTISGRRLAGDI